ncbi:MAG: bifunctional heptose 7-phosphate kinase/heptose 1-phosphate adenyltransferase [Draconibacterium sp.]
MTRDTIYKKKQENSITKKSKILICGDLMLDKYYIGDVQRISPEAPVPIVKFKQMSHNLGGAGNVALNLINLNCEVLLVGAIGKDQDAAIVKSLMKRAGIKNFLIESSEYPTISKTRIISQNQQICRLDIEENRLNKERVVENFNQNILPIVNEFDLIILSDYNKGLLDKNIIEVIVDTAKYYDIPIFVDPKKKDFSIYHGVTTLTPNENEFFNAINLEKTENLEIIVQEVRTILKKNNIKSLLLTRGAKGMLWIDSKRSMNIQTAAKEVFDVTGAGDTVIAVFSYAISNGFTIEESINLSNKAAGHIVSSFGVRPITYNELFKEIDQKIVQVSNLDNNLDTISVKYQKIHNDRGATI